MAIYIWVNIGSDNGLVPDNTKTLPEPMLTYYQWDPLTNYMSKYSFKSQDISFYFNSILLHT